MIQVEIWECTACNQEGVPCRIEIHYDDANLPRHLKNAEHLRKRACVCDEDTAAWHRIELYDVAILRREITRLKTGLLTISSQALACVDKSPTEEKHATT